MIDYLIDVNVCIQYRSNVCIGMSVFFSKPPTIDNNLSSYSQHETTDHYNKYL